MKITTIGIDLAKSVFSIHGVDEHGKCVLKRQVRRDQLLEVTARLEPRLIGMEACSGAHHFARELRKLGHTHHGPAVCATVSQEAEERRQ